MRFVIFLIMLFVNSVYSQSELILINRKNNRTIILPKDKEIFFTVDSFNIGFSKKLADDAQIEINTDSALIGFPFYYFGAKGSNLLIERTLFKAEKLNLISDESLLNDSTILKQYPINKINEIYFYHPKNETYSKVGVASLVLGLGGIIAGPILLATKNQTAGGVALGTGALFFATAGVVLKFRVFPKRYSKEKWEFRAK